MSFPHPELPIGSFIAVICLLVCLPSHIRVRNVASTSLNLWLCIVCIINVVNSFVWANDMIVRIPVWCDISTKFIIASNLGLPAAAFSICRFLCDVAKPNAGEQTKEQKRRRALVEIFLCWGQPAIIMALHYIVQGHRFDIYEYIGCQPDFYVSWASLFIISFPPLVYCFGTFFYAGFALWYFLQRRLQFDELLYLRHPGMTTNRYLRLMVVATAEMIWGTPWYLFVLVANISEQPGLQPWVSWEYVHYDWQRVGQIPLSLMSPTERSTRLALWWTVPVSGYLFFVFFGFSEQAMKDYRYYFRLFRIRVLRQDPRLIDAPPAQRRSGLQRKQESFEAFSKGFSIPVPHKEAIHEDPEDPDTMSGWASKVAKQEAMKMAAFQSLNKEDAFETSDSASSVTSKAQETASPIPPLKYTAGPPDASFASLEAGQVQRSSQPVLSVRSAVCCSCHLPVSNSPSAAESHAASHEHFAAQSVGGTVEDMA